MIQNYDSEIERRYHPENFEEVELCAYGNTKAIDWCGDCGLPLCSFCGYHAEGEKLCNKCYEEFDKGYAGQKDCEESEGKI